MNNSILFYNENDKEYGYLSNFYGKKNDSNFKLVIDKKKWKTSEHYYQSCKFIDFPEYVELIRNATTPNIAKIYATQKVQGGYPWRTKLNPIINEYKQKGVRIDRNWNKQKIDVMRYVLEEKFEQNPHLAKKLIDTYPYKLVEHTNRDAFWGDGIDGNGENMLGRLLEEMRKELIENK